MRVADPNCKTVLRLLEKAVSVDCAVCEDGPCRFRADEIYAAVANQARTEIRRQERIIATAQHELREEA